jgi:hypothetical protein
LSGNFTFVPVFVNGKNRFLSDVGDVPHLGLLLLAQLRFQS